MPKSALRNSVGNRLQLSSLCFAVLVALVAPPRLAEAAVNARLVLDEDADAAPFVRTVPKGVISLTGFQCGLISEDSAAAFAADLDYSETPQTIGLEFVLDAGGLPPLTTGASRSGLEDLSAAEMKTPLSARLNRILIKAGVSSLTDGSVMEEVFLPEASMSVADLMGRCHP